MGLSFCAIDFETANAFRGSPCAVGLVRVVDGRVTGTAAWLMRPPTGYDEFDEFNIAIHGITPAMVKGEPRFGDRLPQIVAFAGDLPLVAHNAAFDVGVIRDACNASGLPWPALTYACSLVLARQTYDLLSYSLPWVAEAAGLEMGEQHDPAADAMAAAGIVLDLARRRQVETLSDLVRDSRCLLGHTDGDAWSRCLHQQPGDAGYLLSSPNPDADPSHPFYGREMVFTGALASMTRAQAWEVVAERGATPAPGVTKHTGILVMGFQDARVLRPGATLSAKARKAAELRAKGQAIELMPEEDFFQQLAL
ncbi:MAG TPA: exonuclease domain-containing protein [Candidatus Limnocylindrales bacterium]